MINDRIIEIAKIQGSLFEYSCKKRECASSFFIKQFLYSSLAKRMNDINFLYESSSITDLYNELSKEKKLNVGKEIYPEAVMYWIGYLLAVMAINNNYSPQQIYRIITPKELFISYEAYHSFNVEDAIDRIIESKMNNKNDLELFKTTR